MPWLRGDHCASPAEMRERRWSCTRKGERIRKARGNNHGPVQDSRRAKTGRDGADQRREECGAAVHGIMDRFKIQGGRKLEGTVRISGAKNAALPCMAAALLTADTVTLQNIPHVRDIITMAKLLAH